jgi:mono/diheme cytochrome c family protein
MARWRMAIGLCLMGAVLAACGGDSYARGEQVFAEHCGECHSVDAAGTVLEGPNLRELFKSQGLRSTLRNGQDVTVLNVQALISTGYGDMEGVALEPDEMEALIEYMVELPNRE